MLAGRRTRATEDEPGREEKRESRRSGGRCGGTSLRCAHGLIARYRWLWLASPSATTVPGCVRGDNGPDGPSLKRVARNRGNFARVPSAPTTVSTGTEAVLFNALPLLVLAGVYFAVTAALVPA